MAKMHQGVVENTSLKDEEVRVFTKDIETAVKDLLDKVVASHPNGMSFSLLTDFFLKKQSLQMVRKR